MGIDIGDAHWAYSGFARFRDRLAAHEGFNLREMDGFTANGRPWDSITTDLVPLLNHSDCDGDLSPEECAQVAPRLAAILDDWDDGTGDDYDVSEGRILVKEMIAAVDRDEPLEFW